MMVEFVSASLADLAVIAVNMHILAAGIAINQQLFILLALRVIIDDQPRICRVYEQQDEVVDGDDNKRDVVEGKEDHQYGVCYLYYRGDNERVQDYDGDDDE